MNPESMGSLSSLSKQNQKTTLEKQLDFQEAIPPAISDSYYTAAVDFISHLYNTEYHTGKNYEAVPKEFRQYALETPNNKVLGDGSIKLAAVRLQQLQKDYNYTIENKRLSILIKNLVKDLKEKFGFAATYEFNKHPKLGYVIGSYLACFPGSIIKNEKGEWVAKENEEGSAQFFALLVARGIVEEKVILDDSMANLGLKGIHFKETFLKTLENLRNEGTEKIIEEPLLKFGKQE